MNWTPASTKDWGQQQTLFNQEKPVLEKLGPEAVAMLERHIASMVSQCQKFAAMNPIVKEGIEPLNNLMEKLQIITNKTAAKDDKQAKVYTSSDRGALFAEKQAALKPKDIDLPQPNSSAAPAA